MKKYQTLSQEDLADIAGGTIVFPFSAYQHIARAISSWFTK